MGFQLFVLCIANIFPSFWVCSWSYRLELFTLQAKKTQFIKGDLCSDRSKVSSGCFASVTEKHQVLSFSPFQVARPSKCHYPSEWLTFIFRFECLTTCVETDFHWPCEAWVRNLLPLCLPVRRPTFNYMSSFLIRTNSWVHCLCQSDLYQSWWQRQQGYLGRLNQ